MKVLGSNAFFNIHPDDVAQLKHVHNKILENPGIPFRSEYRLKCKDNSWKYLEAVGSNFLDDPVIQGIVVNVRDVSERKKMQQILLENELKFRT